MACAGCLLLLLSLLPMSSAWRTKSLFLFHKVRAHATVFTHRGGPCSGSLGLSAPFLQVPVPTGLVWAPEKEGAWNTSSSPRHWGPQDS